MAGLIWRWERAGAQLSRDTYLLSGQGQECNNKKEKTVSALGMQKGGKDSDSKLRSPSGTSTSTASLAFGLVPGMGGGSYPAFLFAFFFFSFFFLEPTGSKNQAFLNSLNNRKPPEGMQEAADGSRTRGRAKERG